MQTDDPRSESRKILDRIDEEVDFPLRVTALLMTLWLGIHFFFFL
nr:hypothetical protein pmam_460 [Pithovirus mammoth]